MLWLIAAPFMLKEIYHHSTEAETISEEVPEQELSEETQPQEELTEDLEEIQEETIPVLTFVESDVSYFDDALLIGDSRMVGIYNFGTISNADFFCTGGLSAADILSGTEIDGMTLTETLENNDYGKIYIMLGLNEIIFGLDEFKNNINQLYTQIREQVPDALIFLMANLHVSKQVGIDQPGISNEKLNTANSYIEEMADGITSFYLDVNPLFDNEEGYLSEEYSDDGIHVSAWDYERWTEWLCQQTITEESRPLVIFQQALSALKDGKDVTRKSWESGILLRISVPVEKKKSDAELMPYISLKTDGRLVPWLASQEDLLADDWMILD